MSARPLLARHGETTRAASARWLAGEQSPRRATPEVLAK
jgi:hypothetical protein